MTISKLITMCGLVFVAITTSGCLKGPVAEGGFSFFPGGIQFDSNGSANN